MSALDDLKKRRDDEDDLSPLEFVILRDSGEWSGAPEESEKAATELAQLRADQDEFCNKILALNQMVFDLKRERAELRAELDKKDELLCWIREYIYHDEDFSSDDIRDRIDAILSAHPAQQGEYGYCPKCGTKFANELDTACKQCGKGR